MSAADRISGWLGLVIGSAVIVAIAFTGGVQRVQEHYAERFGFSPSIGFALSVVIGMAAAIALVAPAGVWIATKIFGYTVTEPEHIERRTLNAAIAIVIIGLFLMLGATPAIPE
jgi:hypothetical protein